jgi:hypothetical protein
MEDFQNAALFGGGSSYQTMGANMLNPGQATSEVDWGAVLMNGIRGAAQGAIASQVQGAYASGQLAMPTPAAIQQQQRSNMTMLLLLGAVAYFVTRG